MNVIPIKIDKDRILFSVRYLGLPKAEIWIGPHEEGPSDDDDERVMRDRLEAEQRYRSGETRRPSGINVFTVVDADGDGYYELNTAGWPTGMYRLNYHGAANESTPFGSIIDLKKRDLQYSWSVFPEETINLPEVLPFIYWEQNGRGYCFRIKVDDKGFLNPAGNTILK